MPAAGAAGQGERGEHRDERGAQRGREEDTAVPRAVRLNEAPACRSGNGGERQRAAGQAERAVSVSERRREGYPPEGSRPRSGLGRVARSRSDAPSLIVWFTAPVSIFSTSTTISITVSIVVCIGVTATSLGPIPIGVPNTGNVIAERCTLSSSAAGR